MNIRPAEIGDEGMLIGLESHGSIAALMLQIAEDEQVYLHGDWRIVADLVDAFVGERVEVVEAEGSAYGAHAIRPLAPSVTESVHVSPHHNQTDLTHI